MTWAILAGVLSGIGSGVCAALVAPFAQRRAEEIRLRQQTRRALIADARAMIAAANAGAWTAEDFWAHGAFVGLVPHLDQATQIAYGVSPKDNAARVWVEPMWPHEQLREELDRLEQEWRLV